MNKQINFEDNLFLLIVRIRMIRDTITLDADPELFLEKTLDDINFVNQSLETLLGYLRENKRLIERDELLDHLSDLEWQFSQVLQELLDQEGNNLTRELPAVRDKLANLRRSSLNRRKEAESLIPERDRLESEPVVSSDELHELLKAL